MGLPGVKGKLGEEQEIKAFCGDLSFKKKVQGLGVQRGSDRHDRKPPSARREVKPVWGKSCLQRQTLALVGHPLQDFPH